MKDFLYAGLIAIFMFFIACKHDNGSTSTKESSKPRTQQVVTVNNTDNVSVKVKGGDNSIIKTTESKAVEKEVIAIASTEVTSAEQLVEEAINTKPTAKVVSKPVQKKSKPIPQTNERPAKKPKPNPVRSAPVKYSPKIEFDELTYDFGEIVEGDIIKHNFTFTNTGKSNLSIEKATATCGCTKPSFPFIDIKPGESGYIGVTYNSVNKDGDQKPEITVYSNANPKEMKLVLTGTVTPKPEQEEEGEANTEVMPQDTTKN